MIVNRGGVSIAILSIIVVTPIIYILSEYYSIQISSGYFILSLLGTLSYLLTSKFDNFLFTAFGASLFPFFLGFLAFGISVWTIAFVPHWGWISLVLVTYLGIWLLPICRPVLSKHSGKNSKISLPTLDFEKIIIGVLVGIGGFGGAASGRLASRAAKTGSNLGVILVGISMISLAFLMHYFAVTSHWERYQKNRFSVEEKE